MEFGPDTPNPLIKIDDKSPHIVVSGSDPSQRKQIALSILDQFLRQKNTQVIQVGNESGSISLAKEMKDHKQFQSFIQPHLNNGKVDDEMKGTVIIWDTKYSKEE